MLLAGALAWTGCVFRQTYPPTWPPRSADCLDVSGVYANVGERWGSSVPFPFGRTVVETGHLCALLLDTSQCANATQVRLSPGDASTLDVWVSADDLPATQRSVPYSCTPRGAKISVPPRWVSQQLGVLRAWGDVYLSKNTDGDLTAKVIYYTYGVVLVVPIIGGGDLWYRFTPIVAVDAPPQ